MVHMDFPSLQTPLGLRVQVHVAILGFAALGSPSSPAPCAPKITGDHLVPSSSVGLREGRGILRLTQLVKAKALMVSTGWISVWLHAHWDPCTVDNLLN